MFLLLLKLELLLLLELLLHEVIRKLARHGRPDAALIHDPLVSLLPALGKKLAT